MRLALVLLVVGCSYHEPGVNPTPIDAMVDAPPDGPLPPHALRRSIIIDGSKVGNVTNFPVWIDLRPPDVPTKAQPDGSDIEFTDASGTVISYEIVDWQPDYSRLAAWVKVPQLQKDMDRTIYVKYGDTHTLPRDPKAVWDNGFVGVWHMNDSLADFKVHDSTGLHDGTAINNLSHNDVVGGPTSLGGGAFEFSSTRAVQFSNPFSGNTTHSIAAWVNQGNGNGTFDAIVVVGNPSAEQSRWFYTNYQNPDIAVGFFMNDWNDTGSSVNNAGWKLLTWTFASDRKSRMYINGSKVAEFVHPAAPNTMGNTGWIGWSPAGWGANNGLNGQIAEVHLSVIQHPDDWVETEYANQSSPSTFYHVGSEEQVP
jgi:Domain of unknown function (DUF2341)/Concanavalin A-like lectin/glucanases superfamily